jgi:hypothetical protein
MIEFQTHYIRKKLSRIPFIIKAKNTYTSLLTKSIASISYIPNKSGGCIQVLSVIHSIIPYLSSLLL